MFRKILIANRGEIACRVASTAHRLGVKTVGVYSTADKFSKHTQTVQEAFHIGDSAPSESYLCTDKIIDIARRTGAEAVHPGYGFLSENADFVGELESQGIAFIGPPASAIQKMGSKSESKYIMDAAKVPIVRGYHGDNQDPEHLLQESRKIGFPVMLKASLGGGGKGMRIVMEEKHFFEQLDAAKREGIKSFGDDHMLVEKYIERPRHIEVQVFGDKHGNYVHLNERDCSVQRRHQKVVEEAPSALGPQKRAEIGEAAVMAAKAVGYWNAGTVEFIFDTTTDEFYFMEMNTRLQVEHPVTELVTGLDLVEWQLRVAANQTLPIVDQKKVPLFGHAMEARIYAEDPDNNFLPGSGHIEILKEPTAQEGVVRIDTGVRQGDTISTFYDPMISKLIVAAPDRAQAIQKLYNALDEYKVVGLPTNIKFLKRVLINEQFNSWDFDTSFIQNNEAELLDTTKAEPSLEDQARVAIASAFLANKQQSGSPWHINDNFRLNAAALQSVPLKFGESESTILLEYHSNNCFSAYVRENETDGHQKTVLARISVQENPERDNELIMSSDSEQVKMGYLRSDDDKVVVLDGEGQQHQCQPKEEKNYSDEAVDNLVKSDFVKSPMPGTVVKCFVKPGQEVKEGEALISVESMKMEFMIRATHDVTIAEVRVGEGQFVQMGERLIIFEKSDDEEQ